MTRAGSDRVFSEAWQRRVFGLTFATLAQGVYNTDENRFARESMDAADYRASSYWELWFAALETNLVDKQIVSFGEIDSRAATLVRASSQATRPTSLGPSSSPTRNARFAVASHLPETWATPLATRPAIVFERARRTRVGHTRLPAYALGREGSVTRRVRRVRLSGFERPSSG